MRFKDLATRTFKISLPMVVVLLMVFCAVTYAENSSQQPTKELEAWEQAQDFSLAHSVVAFAVYGRTKNATAKENAEKITLFFQQQNVASRYFLAEEYDIGSSVGFYIQGVQYGPKALSKAVPLIHQVIAHYKEEYQENP